MPYLKCAEWRLGGRNRVLLDALSVEALLLYHNPLEGHEEQKSECVLRRVGPDLFYAN